MYYFVLGFSRSITSAGEERAYSSVIVFCRFCLEEFPLVLDA